MSQHYYADGAKHIDKHKEINIGGNVSADGLEKLMKGFFADDAEDAGFEEVRDENPSSEGVGNQGSTFSGTQTEKPVVLSPARQEKLKRLLNYVRKGDWISPATVSGMQTYLKTVLGALGEKPLTGEDAQMSAALWKMLEQGRGDDRVVLVMQNLIGYFVSRGWLPKGSPALNKAFFGKEEGYPNIDKGNPQSSGMSTAFRSVLPLLDKVRV